MFNNSKAIVIRSFPFKDNKCISKIYTREFGLVSFIVSKKKTILTQPLTIINVTYRSPKTKNLYYIKEEYVEYVYKTVTSNHVKINLAIIMSDILTNA